MANPHSGGRGSIVINGVSDPLLQTVRQEQNSGNRGALPLQRAVQSRKDEVTRKQRPRRTTRATA